MAIAEPQGNEYYGAQVAAPVFSSITRQVLLYLGVHPERAPLPVWPGQTVLAGFGAQVPAAPAVPAALDEVPTDGDDHAEEAGPDPVLWRGPAISVAPVAPVATPPPAPSASSAR